MDGRKHRKQGGTDQRDGQTGRDCSSLTQIALWVHREEKKRKDTASVKNLDIERCRSLSLSWRRVACLVRIYLSVEDVETCQRRLKVNAALLKSLLLFFSLFFFSSFSLDPSLEIENLDSFLRRWTNFSFFFSFLS